MQFGRTRAQERAAENAAISQAEGLVAGTGLQSQAAKVSYRSRCYTLRRAAGRQCGCLADS